jgi:hypothetical protein
MEAAQFKNILRMPSAKLKNQENRILGLTTQEFKNDDNNILGLLTPKSQNNDTELLEYSSGVRGILAPG